MTYAVHTLAGAQPIANANTTQAHALGTIVRATDPTYGEGEFIYLQGVASTIVGSVVEYNSSYQTGLYSIATQKPDALAVAMSICTASYYGWYQIGGLAQIAKATSTSFAADAYLGATSGLAVAAVSGLRLSGAVVALVASAVSGTAPDLVTVMINRPKGPAIIQGT